jgi:hypothetical protein
MVALSVSVPIAGSPRRTIPDFARNLVTGWSARRENRRVYRQLLGELRGYSRRNLLDMGIDPEGVETFARKEAGL